MSRVSARVSEVSGKQDDSATADAVSMGVGLVLFWPALFFLAATDDQKEELGRLKGEYEALQRVSTQKKCSFPAAPTDEEKKAATPTTKSFALKGGVSFRPLPVHKSQNLNYLL